MSLAKSHRIIICVCALIATNNQSFYAIAFGPSYRERNVLPNSIATTRNAVRNIQQQQKQRGSYALRLQSINYEHSAEFRPRTSLNDSSDLNGTGAEDAVLQSSLLDGDNGNVYKTAIRRTLFWVGAAIGYGFLLIFVAGPETSGEFFAGYLLEQSLSIDNLLVFLLLFEYFKVPMEYQNRVLNWGIIGSIVMRATMIGAGAVALQKFHEVLLVFAAILLFSSAKVILGEDDEEDQDLSQNEIVKFSNKIISSTDKFDGDKFYTEIDGVLKATPMLLCMITVEISDVVFAVDSIPAVFGVTENPLVVFSSNMFAIMGLRSLYIILSKLASELKYLEKAVAVVLGFIGGKLIAEYFGIVISTELSLAVVVTMLGAGVAASLIDESEEEIKRG